MTRKDFEAIAVALKTARPEDWSPRAANSGRRPDLETWERTVNAVAAVFAAGNPRFDLARFRRACGWEV